MARLLKRDRFLFVVAICHFGMQTTGSILMRIRCFCVQRIIGGYPGDLSRGFDRGFIKFALTLLKKIRFSEKEKHVQNLS